MADIFENPVFQGRDGRGYARQSLQPIPEKDKLVCDLLDALVNRREHPAFGVFPAEVLADLNSADRIARLRAFVEAYQNHIQNASEAPADRCIAGMKSALNQIPKLRT